MKNSLKRIVTSTLAIAMIAVSLVSLGMVTAEAAGNYMDTSYTFKFQNAKLHTSLRPKFDDTSSYMKCNECTAGASYTARVVASASDLEISYQDVSRGHVYNFTTGSVFKMVNYVYESGYPYAAIECTPNVSRSFTANGVWSPDSI